MNAAARASRPRSASTAQCVFRAAAAPAELGAIAEHVREDDLAFGLAGERLCECEKRLEASAEMTDGEN